MTHVHPCPHCGESKNCNGDCELITLGCNPLRGQPLLCETCARSKKKFVPRVVE